MKAAVIAVQCVTFWWLGAIFFAQGNWRFGVAQVMLGIVNVFVYF